MRDSKGRFRGAEAVVDKDRSTVLLALELDVRLVVFLTSVDHAFANYGKQNQTPIESANLQEVTGMLDEGHFAAGSMQPKIEAAGEFVSQSPRKDAQAIITNSSCLADALQGRKGTRISKK